MSMPALPEGWTLTRYPVTIEVRDTLGRVYYAEPYGNEDPPISEWELKKGVIERTWDKIRQEEADRRRHEQEQVD